MLGTHPISGSLVLTSLLKPVELSQDLCSCWSAICKRDFKEDTYYHLAIPRNWKEWMCYITNAGIFSLHLVHTLLDVRLSEGPKAKPARTDKEIFLRLQHYFGFCFLIYKMVTPISVSSTFFWIYPFSTSSKRNSYLSLQPRQGHLLQIGKGKLAAITGCKHKHSFSSLEKRSCCYQLHAFSFSLASLKACIQ